MKATYAVINGEEKVLFKDPKTDNGIKISQRGRVVVLSDAVGELSFEDGLYLKDWIDLQNHDEMEDVFVDGKLIRD
jgi:nicotinamide phosphoribosyltransferase